jgi:hypothetical protein
MFARKLHRNPQPSPKRHGSFVRLWRSIFPGPQAPAQSIETPKPVRLADLDPVMRDLAERRAALRQKHARGVQDIEAQMRARTHAILAGAHR